MPGAALAASVAALAMFMSRQAPEVAAPAAPQMEIASTAQPRVSDPRPVAPAPEQPQAPAGAAQVAATAVAVAEVPRRAAERRSRAQQQRAATTRTVRNAPAPRLVAHAGAPVEPALVPAPVATPANPFAPADAAGAIATRPWPRALLPDAGSAFSVGYGRLQATPTAFQQYAPFNRDTATPSTEPTESEDVN